MRVEAPRSSPTGAAQDLPQAGVGPFEDPLAHEGDAEGGVLQDEVLDGVGADELQVGLEAFRDVPGHDDGQVGGGGGAAHRGGPGLHVAPGAVLVAQAVLGGGALAGGEEPGQFVLVTWARSSGWTSSRGPRPASSSMLVAQGPGIGEVLVDPPAVGGHQGHHVARRSRR